MAVRDDEVARDVLKVDRLVGILSVLLQRDKMTAPELAELFEVSRRTIARDIDSLNMAGIPIQTTRGVRGGIRIMEGYRLDKTALTSADLQSILAGLRGLDSASKTRRYAALMEKLSAGSSTTITADEHVLINLAAWDRAAVSERIETVHGAIEEQRSLSFLYVAPSGETHRTIEPYYLIFEWSSWYVWGYCELRDDFRLFKLSRMTDMKVESPFASREAPLPQLSGDCVFPKRCRVRARVQPQCRWRLIEEFGPTSLTECEDGMLLFSADFSCQEQAMTWVLSLGDGIELLEPVALRAELAEFGQRLRERYDRA